MKDWSRYVPLFAVAAAIIYLLAMMFPAEEPVRKMQLHEFAKIPIADHGRVKPIDTLARTDLMIVSGRQEVTDRAGNRLPAIQWLLDTMTNRLARTGAADKHKVFRIDDDQVLSLLRLEARPLFWRYAVSEFADKMEMLEKQADKAEAIKEKDRDAFNENILKLRHHLSLYIGLQLLEGETLRLVPPQSPDQDWKSFRDAASKMQMNGQDDPAVRSLLKMLLAYGEDKPEEFNTELASYRTWLNEQMPDEVQKANFEVFFNDFEPFYHCTILYVGVFLLACISWVAWSQPLNRAAFWLAVVTLVVHSWAIIARMYLLSRPPIINLYSTAIFIGWGCLVLGLIIEWIFRNGVGTVVAAVAGFATMVIAHNLATDGDTLQMMQAVLDTNFWLATHVVIINFGYAATFVAGLVAILFIVLGVFSKALNKELFRVLGQVIYGIVCFATLLSFTGTVLGGIWADQSWGRFWGWDPKENGALLIVLWNALILHARWGGLVKQRGMAVLAVFGNIVTSWSWFGVNMLGVGLHSYGFMKGALFWLLAFIASQLVLIGIGLVPTRYWQSFAAAQTAPGTSRRARLGEV